MSKLFTPLQIKGISLKNRIVMSPMCQYSAIDGFVNDWHYTHYISRAIGGCGTIIQEATAVVPEGRISYADLGIWTDEHIGALKELTSAIEKYGAIPGIQLAHAGRKASCDLAWKGGHQIKSGVDSWQTVAPSPIPFYENDIAPLELSSEDIKTIVDKFKEAAERAIKAGYKVLELHAAHGYLIHQFLSPITNHRSDEYGGSFENRIRFLLQIVDKILPLLNENLSLWVRISATDWVENGWNPDESVKLSSRLKSKGVDVIDVSTGGNVAHVKIPVAQGYQIPFASEIRQKTEVITGAVGLITQVSQAEDLLDKSKCDLVFIGRELLRNPYFALQAAIELDEDIDFQKQYERSFK